MRRSRLDTHQPPALQPLVLMFKPPIGPPAHARWFRREIFAVERTPTTAHTHPETVGTIGGSLVWRLTRGGVHETIALPASEIASSKYPAAPAPTLQLPRSAQSSRRRKKPVVRECINSLARTHELLSESNWRGASLAEIVRREFVPYTRGHTEARGPSVTLKAAATQAVATVLHELTTNAAKYGALSNRSGRVSVHWRWLQNGSHNRLLIDWWETGGPPVLTPSRSGYGTSIIRELIPFELGGGVELSFAPEGSRCRLEIPAEWTARGRQRAEKREALDSI